MTYTTAARTSFVRRTVFGMLAFGVRSRRRCREIGQSGAGRALPAEGHMRNRYGAFALAALLPLAWFATARAATVTVDTTVDAPTLVACDDGVAGDCSLRGAILAANGRPPSEPTTIDVPAGTYVLSQSSSCTYTLHDNPTVRTTTQRPLCIARNVTVRGAGADATIIDANLAHRVLFVSAGATVELSGLTVTRGMGDAGFGLLPNGGGIANEGTLTLRDSVVSDNTIQPGAAGAVGGGIDNRGILTLRSSVVSDNVASFQSCGGGINNGAGASLTLADSTVAGNVIAVHGGGICNTQGVVVISGSTVSGNRANGLGGGIVNFGGAAIGSVTIVDSTISGNTSLGSGGGLYNGLLTDVHLANVTITDNAAGDVSGGGGGIVNDTDRVFRLENSVIAGNRDPHSAANADCISTRPLVSGGHNLVRRLGTCTLVGDATGNLTGLDPGLGVLTDNGGPARTHAPTVGSPLVDAGNPSQPGGGGAACAAIDQRGFVRPLGARCDIGAVERSDAFAVMRMRPNRGGNAGTVTAFVAGGGFVEGATVALTRAGHADVAAAPTQVDAGGSAIAGTFDLTGVTPGSWNVVVRNPDGASQTLAGAFEIEMGGAPDLWVNVIGRLRRGGGLSRLLILYGNRGNVDAVATPLSLSVGTDFTPSRSFALAPPPPQPGQARTDWSQVPVAVRTQAGNRFVDLPLLLPVVPAGSSGILPLGITFPPAAMESQLLTTLGNPIVLDAATVGDAVAGAGAYLEREGLSLPPGLVPELEQYLVGQYDQVAVRGRAAFVGTLGTGPEVYSAAQLHFDLAFFAALRVLGGRQASGGPGAWLLRLADACRSLLSRLEPAAAYAECPIVSCKAPGTTNPGCSCMSPDDAYIPPQIPTPPGCAGSVFERVANPQCRPTEPDCQSLGTHKVVVHEDGSTACVPTNPPNGCPKDPLKIVPGKQCLTFPLRPRTSHDPNDKVGTLGVTPTQFLLASAPLGYVVHFENLETANAPAQTVVVTDQLDVATVDLSTLSLGPITVGTSTLLPQPGVQQYRGGLDLRPEQNLVVTVEAGLDPATGLLTWRFTSIDPDTGQLTEDPDAGLLPPNLHPPDGEGSVAFSVQPKAGLVTGTAIRNRATIVFDDNAPIDTPEWSNTIDATAPVSQVVGVDPSDCNATELTVRWSGTDADSGIDGYALFASADGGPFAPVVDDTSDTSVAFTGELGRTYRFYTVARDGAGNLEAPPAEPDLVRAVGGCGANDFAITKMTRPRTVALSGAQPTRVVQVKVHVQNRSPYAETIPDAAVLADLVALEVRSLTPSCPAAAAVLHAGRPQKPLPVTLASKKTLPVVFDVTIDCASDPLRTTAKSFGHEDYSLHATVRHGALGSGDAHPVDDSCPRQVSPPGVIDPYPNGKLIDKGCGMKKADKTLGAPVLMDVEVKP